MEPDKETAIVPMDTVRPVVSAERAKADWDEFVKLKSMILTSDDVSKVKAKQRDGTSKDMECINKSGFRKLAMAFNLSDTIIEQVRTDRTDERHTFFWRITVQVQAPNGRVSTGVAICDSAERTFFHLEHDVYSTAHTRAKNRAISDLIAGGAVSAEEMETESSAGEPQPPPAPSKLKPTSPKRGNSEERVFSFKGAGPESGPEPSDPHPF